MRPVPWIVAASLLLAVLRLLAAARLDLIGDESFYVLCARHPAWAYADHPFMTALWVRTGIELAGASPLGVRLLFLVSGLLFPLAVHRLARPIVGERDAAWAAGVSLCVPILAQQGVVAVPDVPLWLFAVLALHGVERGVATGRAGAFLLAGVATALGLATHLRFALVPLAFALHAALRPEVRRAWRSPPARWARAVGARGVLPVLLRGAADGVAGLRYQL
ncbi:MAG: glycosyltransferase family 39 protein, partial [Myxococcota bacterium]